MTNLLLTLYQLMLRLYPSRFYATFGREMAEVFAEKLHQAADNRAMLVAFARELRHWPGNCLHEHWAAQHTAFNLPSYEKLSWRGTAVAALPYLLMALLFGVVYLAAELISGLPASSALYNGATYVVIGIFIVTLIIAWWQHWPTWSVSWLGFLAFLLLYVLAPQFLLQTQFAWGTPAYLLQMITAEVMLPLLLLGIYYWLVGRWPIAGAIVLLPPIGFSWLLQMEFVPENVTSLIFILTWSWLAVVVILMGRWGNGRWHGWLLGLAGLIIGLVSSYAGQFWVSIPRDGSMTQLMEMLLSEFVPTLLPLVAILLLHALRRKLVAGHGRSALRPYRLLFWGIVGIIGSSQIAQRLFLPDDLVMFQAGVGVVITAVFLLSLLGIILGVRGLRGSQPGWFLLVLLVLFPFLYQAGTISDLLVGLPFLKLSNEAVLYETIRLGSRAVGLVWLGLSAWLLGRMSPAKLEKLTDEAVSISIN